MRQSHFDEGEMLEARVIKFRGTLKNPSWLKFHEPSTPWFSSWSCCGFGTINYELRVSFYFKVFEQWQQIIICRIDLHFCLAIARLPFLRNQFSSENLFLLTHFSTVTKF